MNEKTLYITNDELYNYYQQIKEGVYKELDEIYAKIVIFCKLLTIL